MIQTTKKLLLAAAITTSLNAAGELSQNEIKQIENLELFKRAQISVTKAYDMGNLYALKINVQGNNDEVFLTKDKKRLITGEVIDTDSGAKISTPADLTGVRGKEAFVYGSGTDEYFLFTDPECPYCKKFESYLSQVEKNVKIRVFYYPLEMHRNAKDMSLYILSKKTKEAKIEAMLHLDVNSEAYKNRKYSEEELTKLEAQLAEQMDIATNLSVQGTPAVFDKDGKSVAWPNMLQKYGVTVN